MGIPGSKTPILVYHKVSNTFEWGLTRVCPEVFEAHIQFLVQNGFKSVPANETQCDPPNRAVGDRRVCLCFDDAYEDVFYHAYPVLARYGFTATVAAVTGFIGSENTWDVNLGGIRFKHMTAGQLTELSDNGWEIASHSRTHRALTGLDPESRHSEIAGSKKELEDIVGVPIRFFVYPFGKFDTACVETVKDAGYVGAAGFFQKFHEPGDAPFNRERQAVYQFDSVGRLNAKLNGNRYEKARLRLINLGSNATIVTKRLGLVKN